MEHARILIVEDEPHVAQDIAMRLEGLNYKIAGIARTAKEAIALTASNKPDLILMDIVLQGSEDGIEAAAKIIRQRPDLPILYLTSYDETELLERAKITEPFAYLIKPCDQRDLRAAITVALYKTQSQKQKQKHLRICAALEKLSDPLIAVDKERVIFLANDAAARFLGYQKNSLEGRDIAELVNLQLKSEGRNLINHFLYKLFSSHETVHAEHNITLSNAHHRATPVSVKIQEIEQSHQCEGGALILLTNLSKTSIMQREIELAASVFDNCQEGILIIDQQCHIVKLNQPLLQFIGYQKDELIGAAAKLLSPEDNASVDNSGHLFWQQLIQHNKWEGYIQQRKKNATSFTCRMHMVTLPANAMHPPYYICTYRLPLDTDVCQPIETDYTI